MYKMLDEFESELHCNIILEFFGLLAHWVSGEWSLPIGLFVWYDITPLENSLSYKYVCTCISVFTLCPGTAEEPAAEVSEDQVRFYYGKCSKISNTK